MKPRGTIPGSGELRFFLVATFAWSWAFWLGLAGLARADLVSPGSAPFIILHMAGGLGPTILALVCAARRAGERPLAGFLRTWLPGRLSPGGFAVLGAGLILSVPRPVVVRALDPGSHLLVENWPAMLTLFPAMIVGGGLEEPGWRGIVFEDSKRLRSGDLGALAGMAALWTAWHLPLWLIPGTYQSTSMDLPAFALNVAGLTLILYAFRMSGASVGWCVLSHAFYNTVLGVFVPNTDITGERLVSAVALAAILALFLVFRGRLRARSGTEPAQGRA
jgi:hypothetical protein